MVSVQNISVHFGSFELLKEVSFLIRPQDRIGLTGKNGAGKTTLLRIICGLEQPSAGKIEKPSGLRIGYLPQEMTHNDVRTVREEVKLAFSEVLAVRQELEEVNREISLRKDYTSDAYHNLLNKSVFLHERLAILGSETMEGRIETVLTGLGFQREDLDRPASWFSGGWRMRIELAKILLSDPDLLLLDEPTNHLDIESIQWLEEFLAGFRGAAVIISHDRTFLDNVTRRTIEIVKGKIYDYGVPYSEFVVLSRERREQQKAAAASQQKMIEDTERFIERFRYKATKAVQVQSRIKMLEKLGRIEPDEEDDDYPDIRFPSAVRSGTIVLEAVNLTKYYGDNLIINRLNFVIERGQKVAFIGRNGEGKTTLSKIIVGETDYSGLLKIGHNVSIGYFAQNTDELLQPEKTVWETVDQIAKGEIRTRLRDLLGAFLFRGDAIDKKVKVLSGGEKSRLALVRLLLEPHNLLVLDEPTNHLDMRSKDILKQALLAFEGTLIVVSHDRDFLHGLTTAIFEFRNHSIHQYQGDISDFLARRKLASLNELNQKKESVKKLKEEDQEKELSREAYRQKKETERKLRKINTLIQESEERISVLEKQINDITKELSENIPHSHSTENTDLYTTFEKLNVQLQEEMERWTSLHTEAEQIKNSNEGQ